MSDDQTVRSDVYKISGMDCPDCAFTIEKGLQHLPGVRSVKVDFMSSQLKVDYDAEVLTPDRIGATVKEIGYQLENAPPLTKSTFAIRELDCADEAMQIESRLKKHPGIHDLKFNVLEGKVTIQHSVPVAEVLHELKAIGFTPEILSTTEESSGGTTRAARPAETDKKSKLLAIVVSGALAIAGVILHYFSVWPILSLTFLLAAIAIGGIPVFRRGVQEARYLRLGINFLMTVAVLGAAILGDWSEAAMVVFLFALANYLEDLSMDRARRSIRSLMNLTPEIVSVIRGEKEIKESAEAVAIGEKILVRPGERIQLDGRVLEGESRVNQAPITGESEPVKKKPGDPVYAGSVNGSGALVVEVTSRFQDSMLSRIIHLVEEAQSTKAHAQTFVERFAKYYTPAVVIFSILLATLPPLLTGASFHEWFYRALVLLVIACPCALVISTPVAIVSGLTNAARRGVLLKGGVYLEEFAKIRALAFDKTGTLTTGQTKVVRILPLDGVDTGELLRWAASAENHSEHPLAQAILNAAEEQEVVLSPAENFRAIPGKGVQATVKGKKVIVGNHALFEELKLCDTKIHATLEEIENASQTAALVGVEDRLLGIVAIADAVRPQARATIAELRKLGIGHLVMLTGDNHRTAAAIAREVGIDAYYPELLPQEKVKIVQDLEKKYGHVAMVGDGINDAPALAAASVGISMGASGTDTALETSDVALMKDDLARLPFLRRLSRKTLSNIKQNITVAVGLKAIFLALTLMGMATLWMAVIADMGASLIVVFNGLRVLRYD